MFLLQYMNWICDRNNCNIIIYAYYCKINNLTNLIKRYESVLNNDNIKNVYNLFTYL